MTRAALVTPLSGPLALYGRAGAVALRLWGRLAGVELDVIDAHPSPAAALARLATEGRAPDVLFGPYGSGPALAVARRWPAVLWNHGGATDRLHRRAFPGVVNVPAPARTYLDVVLRAMADHGQARAGGQVVLLHSTTGFGREVAAGALGAATDLGLGAAVRPFAPGRGDAAAEGAPDGDVLLVAGAFADEVAIAERLLAWPWGAVGLVSAGVDEVLAPLGGRLEGVYGPCQWVAEVAPPPSVGPDAHWFAAAYQREAGGPPPYPAAAALAAGVLWQRCVDAAGSAHGAAVLAAARALRATTLFGPFHLDPLTGLQRGHHVHVVRWTDGRRAVVGPA